MLLLLKKIYYINKINMNIGNTILSICVVNASSKEVRVIAISICALLTSATNKPENNVVNDLKPNNLTLYIDFPVHNSVIINIPPQSSPLSLFNISLRLWIVFYHIDYKMFILMGKYAKYIQIVELTFITVHNV